MAIRIPQISPENAVKIVQDYLRLTSPQTRAKFLKLLKPVIKEYDKEKVL